MAGKLTALKVRNLTTPGRYGDGGGLWLQVRDAEHRSWLFRYMRHGVARQMGLGPLELVSLAEAREAAVEGRRMLLRGEDPLATKRAKRAAAAAECCALTFKDVAERYIAAHAASWRNEKHRAQWTSTLGTYVFPIFGGRAVASVDTGDVIRVLEPIWSTKAETASRLRGRMESVLDYATARTWRTGENPARWRGHLQNLLPKRSKVARVEHHAALPYAELPTFMGKLHADSSVSARALEFTILTAARTGEVLGATWSEIDTDARVWTIPAERMKAGREHRIPLTDAALAVLEAMRPLQDPKSGDLVFPGQRRGKPLSNMAMTMLLRRHGSGDITVHGFRSTFRDWTAETTSTPREVAEAALAHMVGNKVEAAYRRGDLFAKRRELMEAWAGWCLSG